MYFAKKKLLGIREILEQAKKDDILKDYYYFVGHTEVSNIIDKEDNIYANYEGNVYRFNELNNKPSSTTRKIQ